MSEERQPASWPDLADLDKIVRAVAAERNITVHATFERIRVEGEPQTINLERVVMAASSSPPSNSKAVFGYACLSILSLIIALGMGWWIVSQSDVLGMRFDRAYYMLLAILGLAVALMLFGAMRSTASVTGRHLGVVFDVGGPAAMFVLVVGGGFWLTEAPASFNAKFRLHYAGSESDRAAYNAAVPSAKIHVFVGLGTQEHSFNNQGEVVIFDVPGRFRDGFCDVELISDRIQFGAPNQTRIHFRGPDEVIELNVVLRPRPR